MGTWWTGKELEPYRKFRFQVFMGNNILKNVRTVQKPSFEISQLEYQVLNQKVKYPGIVTWTDIDLVFIDDKAQNIGAEWRDYLKAAGYTPFSPSTTSGITKGSLTDGAKRVTKQSGGQDIADLTILIKQLDSSGKVIEQWQLHNSWIKSVKYGDLDYNSDDFVEVTLTIAYDFATIS
jgi:hypothetical protein